MFKTSKPRILPPKKSPKKKAPGSPLLSLQNTYHPSKAPEPEESAVEPNLDYSMQSKALTEQSVSEEIHHLSFMNPETVIFFKKNFSVKFQKALQKNGIIRNHMASLSRFNTSMAERSSVSFFKTGTE